MTPVPASGETPPQLRKAAASLRPEERSVTLLGPGVKQDYPAVRLRAFTGLSCFGLRSAGCSCMKTTGRTESLGGKSAQRNNRESSVRLRDLRRHDERDVRQDRILIWSATLVE